VSLVAAPADKRFRRVHVKPSRRRGWWRPLLAPATLYGGVGLLVAVVTYEAGALEIELTDDADSFNPLLVPAPDVGAPIEDRVPGGLGIALVRALADEVQYARDANRNRVTMRFEANRGTRDI